MLSHLEAISPSLFGNQTGLQKDRDREIDIVCVVTEREILIIIHFH